jgi:hypothetical protein
MAEGTGLPPQLIKYWTAGAGAARINWGVSGDFNRCKVNIGEEAAKHGSPLSDHVLSGLCSTLHVIATGARPGHAPGEGGKS